MEAVGGSGSRNKKLSEEQVSMLEKHLGNEHGLESERKDKLALELGLDPRQVAVRFQNRRARWKNKKLEGEYSMLKSTNEAIVVEKLTSDSSRYFSTTMDSLVDFSIEYCWSPARIGRRKEECGSSKN